MHPVKALSLLLLFCLEARPFYTQSQTPAATQKTTAEATIRVGVGLVQTDVTVFDRQGRFVDDLKADQFQLLVDGKPQSIDFFELVTEGGPTAEKASARVTPSTSTPSRKTSIRPDAGRTLLFFLDDLHLSADSMMRSRTALLSLIDQSMGVNDRAAIFTASRQLGFLQQLSDNKSVLRMAVARLTFNNEAIRDLARPVMTEAQAAAIEQADPDVFGYFVDQTVSADGLPNDAQGRAMAAEIVRGRAAALAHVSAEFSARSLTTLGNVVQSCAALPGRKLLFFLSDGFILQPQKADIVYRLRLVAEAAARAAIVIYTLDTRGLMVGLPNAASPQVFAVPLPPRSGAAAGGEVSTGTATAEPAGRLERGPNEVLAAQDGLNALASDTGGRFFKNTNALDTAIVAGMEEASRYYLLGWHIDPDLLVPGKYSSIRIKLKDRPDLSVHLRQGAMDLSKLIPKSQPKAGKAAPAKAAPNTELVQALQFPWPIEELPIFLYAGYYYQPEKGYVLDISFQVEVEGQDSGASSGKDDRIEVMGIVANREGGNVDRFKDSIGQSADPSSPAQPGKGRFAGVRLVGIEPGIYQVRVAVRDPKSGRLGSAHQWVDVPRADLLPTPNKKILLGSIFLRRKQITESPETSVSRGAFDEQPFSATRRYLPARLPYSVQIYNAASASISMQTKIYRGNQVVSQSPSRPLAVGAAEISGPFFVNSEVSLEGLPSGSYVLEVIATESSVNAVAKQQVPFWIQAK
ncbi:MAG: VWA domain-containing protein [Acidobacteriia bacterium]|nr:VWA domain-containing protein [Terriglobia bacterium]